MKTLDELLVEARRGQAQPTYLHYTLIGRTEIGAFANALRAMVIDECIAEVEASWTNNNKDAIADSLRALKGATT